MCPYAHQKDLRKGRFSEPHRAYSITKCAFHGFLLTDDAAIARIIIESFFWMEDVGRITVGAFVIMPDHYHLVMRVEEGSSLDGIMRSIGSFTGREIRKRSGQSGDVWQKGYYDRGIRKTEQIQEVFEYVYHNPVRKGLVARAEEWPFSSANPEYRARIRWDLFV